MEAASWVDRKLYPFESHWFQWERYKLHYVDEGEGEPIVFVHGSPGWSFSFRDAIKSLSGSYRCIAPDHLGFGLSDKPPGTTFRPERQAEIFESFLHRLDLKGITLVVHGMGGPIGLSYALKHPDNVRHFVVMNSFLWPLDTRPGIQKAVKFAKSGLGRVLYQKANYAPIGELFLITKDRQKFTKQVRSQYNRPFADKRQRDAPYAYTKALLDSSGWFQSLYQQRDVLKDKPALICWGSLDPWLTNDDLERWTSIWPEAEVHRLRHTGHYVPEEHGADVAAFMDPFLKDLATWSPTSVML
ncbi:MAG: alpha/beta fold hydrolase [Armatimonadetes bacterium]|nr:alpha/beta fold hydrolase [Armatimonadota bacterium]